MLKVFYSWQNDSNKITNRYFIRDAISEALEELVGSGNYHVDSDTQGVPGIPSITDTIFKKIKESDIYVADLTNVTGDPSKKIVPNPNVLLELGYTLFSLGESKIILVMNTNYGGPENIPFDIVHRRRPIQYSLDSTEVSDKESIKKKRKKLEEDLANAIRLIVRDIPENKYLKKISDTFSHEAIQSCLFWSKPADWSTPEDVATNVLQVYYLHDVNLRVVFDHSSDNAINNNYHEEWINGFLHKQASSHYVKVYYNNTELFKEILMVVDAGNAVMPQLWIFDRKFGPIELYAYKFAELFDVNRNLNKYLDIAKKHLLDKGYIEA